MQDPPQEHRHHAAKEFRRSLEALEAFLNLSEEEQALFRAADSAEPKEAGEASSSPDNQIDLAALEEAVADIERYMESRSAEPLGKGVNFVAGAELQTE
ncbi:MAG: hypothetical protein HC886_06910 [Leptolyngbyaceae cyanobacterium SM1_1_3]|nr:hypothetical protein [Leptolyngbyaceae cyanobacterium SM1_1_3]